MGIGKKITGILLIMIGTTMFLSVPIVGLIYGLILIILGGMFLFYPYEENQIEDRKDLNKKKTKK